jgi:phosphoserine phosphatase
MKKAFVFDFDDTLANTFCKVIVCDRDGWPVEVLSPKEFNTHTLESGHYYDFSEFRDEIFIHAAVPTFLIALAQEVSREDHSVFILTARDASVSDAIRMWLLSHDVEVNTIFCAGEACSGETIAEKKAEYLMNLMEIYDKVYFYDDSSENVSVYHHLRLRSYQVV